MGSRQRGGGEAERLTVTEGMVDRSTACVVGETGLRLQVVTGSPGSSLPWMEAQMTGFCVCCVRQGA